MDKQDLLIQNIKNWVRLDNQMSSLRRELKKARDEKKKLSDDLIEIMRDNEIDCFNINDGKLMYSKRKIKKPLSKKHLLTSLAKYFKGSKKEATTVGEFILNTRGEKIVENIRIKK